MLNVNNLSIKVADKAILNNINLQVKPGEVHAIMGPNGSGKSTLASVLAGREGYTTTSGGVTYLEQDLLSLAPEKRAAQGVFLAFQYPVEIPGVNTMVFLQAALNNLRKQRGEPELDAFDFLEKIRQLLPMVGLDESIIKRPLNDGFSGGEKKRNEILQLLLLQPKLAILDETDSGLDIDALKMIASGINSIRSKDNGIIMVTHYQRLLNYVEPDYVHVLMNGNIVKSGDKSLALTLEDKGYGWLEPAK